MDFPLYFQKVMLLWQRSIVEIDYGIFRVFGLYFIGKSLGTFKILIFGLWSFIPHPYHNITCFQGILQKGTRDILITQQLDQQGIHFNFPLLT